MFLSVSSDLRLFRFEHRLWLVPGSGSNQHRSIAYHDVVPDGQDSILDLVARANKKIEHKHLKGWINASVSECLTFAAVYGYVSMNQGA